MTIVPRFVVRGRRLQRLPQRQNLGTRNVAEVIQGLWLEAINSVVVQQSIRIRRKVVPRIMHGMAHLVHAPVPPPLHVHRHPRGLGQQKIVQQRAIM